MNEQELKEKIVFAIDENVEKTIAIYVTTDTTGPQLFNIIERDLGDLTTMFSKTIKSIIVDKEFELENYSTSVKRVDALHVYDLTNEYTVEMERMANVQNIQIPEYFDTSVTKLERINGVYIVIRDNTNQKAITLYKNITNVDKAYAAATFFIFKKENQLFERQKENMLKITPSFQMILVDDNVVLVDLDKIEKPLHLDAILLKETARDVTAISSGIIINSQHLLRVCRKPKICKKLRHALKESKVVKMLNDGSLTNEQIIRFVTEKTELKFHYNKSRTKFELKNEAEAERFVKLMDDDFLLSELTGEKYESTDKDIMTNA